MKRYIKEFANDMKAKTSGCFRADEAADRIDAAVSMNKAGFITDVEAVKMILAVNDIDFE